MATPQVERRTAQRIHVNGEISYLTDEASEFRPGEIENLSAGGALIWIADRLPVGGRLLLRVKPHNEDATVLQFEATVLGKLRKQRDSLYGYACHVDLS
jgi:hypothetical protein